VAALMVLVYHVGLNSGITVSETWGRVISHFNTGVAVFFGISGFLLYRPFVATRLVGKPPPGTVRYAKRRALRILPGY
jgi:peptidoglycan/LPS O-acetylase OafA/YrhL